MSDWSYAEDSNYTQHSQEADIHEPSWIRTYNPSKRAADTLLALGGVATAIGTPVCY